MVYFRFTGISIPFCLTVISSFPSETLIPRWAKSKDASTPNPTIGILNSAIGPIKKPVKLSFLKFSLTLEKLAFDKFKPPFTPKCICAWAGIAIAIHIAIIKAPKIFFINLRVYNSGQRYIFRLNKHKLLVVCSFKDVVVPPDELIGISYKFDFI